MNQPIKLPKKVIRDLDNYFKLVNLAISAGRGKYANISARSLHDMKIFYTMARRAKNVSGLRMAYSFFMSKNRLDDCDMPDSFDEFILRNNI